jgi:hypothetical protein
MATNWPNSVQTFTNPTAGSALNSPSHADQHITVNDTVEALQNYAGLVLVKTQTIGSGVSSVTVTGAFSATFQNYRITYAGIDCSVGDTFLQLQLGASAASYYGCFVAANYTTGTQTVFTRNNASVAYVGVTSTNTDTMGVFDIQQPFDTGRTHLQGTGFGYTTSFFFAMEHAASTSYSSFVLLPNLGTFTGGTIRVYGYNNG